MRFLRSNTAVLVTVGPFFDKTTGVDIETALTITNERITLTADTDAGSAPTNILDNITGATSGTANDLNYITGNDAGMMQLELAAADVNRVGRMFLSITDAANHVPVFHEFFVLPQAIYDWITGVIVPLPANVTQWLGTAAATPTVAGVPEVDVTHVGGTVQTAGDLKASLNTIDDFVDTEIADIQARLPAALTANGNMKSSLVEILTTALTETAGLLAGGFKKFFNVAAPTGTLNSIPDAVAGAAGGLSIVGSAMTLTAGERTSIADAHLDRVDGIEIGLTPRQEQRLSAAAAAGKLSGAATTTVAIRNAVADSKARITATVDADGNRSAVTTDVT